VIEILNYSTDDDVCLHARCKSGTNLNEKDIMSDFKLYSKVNTNNMHLFNEFGRLTKFKSALDIMRHHAKLRFGMYQKRKDNLIKVLEHDRLIARNKARFIREIIDKKIIPFNFKQEELREALCNWQFYEYKNYDYLLHMNLVSTTIDVSAKLEADAKRLGKELEIFQNMTIEEMWLNDLNLLEREYVAYVAALKDKTDEEPKKTNKKQKVK
jgi:DNA topoisomerase II